MTDAIHPAFARFFWRLGVGLSLLAGASAPTLGQRPALGMLDGLEEGRWELRTRGPEGEVERMCVDDGRVLIQLRHPGGGCRRLIVQDADSEITVQYTCPGRGFGRTHIRRETRRLVQIDTQGVADGLPFSASIEGRRVGECGERR